MDSSGSTWRPGPIVAPSATGNKYYAPSSLPAGLLLRRPVDALCRRCVYVRCNLNDRHRRGTLIEA